MDRNAIALSLGLLLGPALAHGAIAQGALPAITDEAARAIAVDAYLYFYPLISVDITRKQSTNIEPGKEFGKGPMNMFVNVPAFPPADLKVVVRINFDTLYSIAWLDLTKEPEVVSVPDTDGRFYLLPMLDMWTDVFASPGWRTTGTKAANYLVTPPGWSGAVPEGFTRISAPTPYVWIIGRTKTDGPADYDAVHKIQAGYKVTPLSRWGKPLEPVTVTIDPDVDMKTPPKIQVDTMPAAKYFTYAAELLKLHPPHITDEPIIAQMKRIGIEPGKSLDFDKLDPIVKKALESAPEAAHQLMAWKVSTLARVANGWSMNTDTMGVYGNYYLKRAIVTQFGLGANLPEDAIYPLNLFDDTGKPLDGANKYTAHFDKGATPPVNAFVIGMDRDEAATRLAQATRHQEQFADRLGGAGVVAALAAIGRDRCAPARRPSHRRRSQPPLPPAPRTGHRGARAKHRRLPACHSVDGRAWRHHGDRVARGPG